MTPSGEMFVLAIDLGISSCMVDLVSETFAVPDPAAWCTRRCRRRACSIHSWRWGSTPPLSPCPLCPSDREDRLRLPAPPVGPAGGGFELLDVGSPHGRRRNRLEAASLARAGASVRG